MKDVRLFYEVIREDETAKYAAEISIVTFGGTVELVKDFANIDRQDEFPMLEADTYDRRCSLWWFNK